MISVRNTRVLHGRSELRGGISARHLQCGYMDWDEIRQDTNITGSTAAGTSTIY